MLRRLVVLGVLLLAACTPSVWNKPGASQNDFSRDRYACLQQAQQRVAGAQVNAYGGTASNTVVTNQGLFASCMNANGWYLQAAKQETQPTQNPLKETLGQLNREGQEICSREEFKSLLNKSACKVEDISLEQLADKSRISQVEMQAFTKLAAEFKTLTKKATVAYRTYGGQKGAEIAVVLEHLVDRREKNSLDLYEGKEAWGEYNRRRKEDFQTYRDEYNQIILRK